MRYDAFVSYSHAADGHLAPALQRGLQRLARPWYRPRASAIFRDETGLAVSPHLWASIVRALDDSEWFVVLCSPQATASEWIEREIDHWLAHRPADRILLVLTDGDLVWDPRRGDFDPARSTAIPPALLGKFGGEPRHLDLRWARGDEQLDVRHPRFRSAVAELAAPIRNMERDELEAEDVRQHRRTMLLARSATSMLVLLLALALVLGGLAWQQRGTARHEAARARRQAAAVRRAATTTLARGLASEALNLAREGRNDLALLLAVEAGRIEPSSSAKSSLLSVLVDQPTLDRELHGLSQTTVSLAFSPDGRALAATDNRRIMLWDLRTGQRLPPLSQIPANNSFGGLAFADRGRLLVGEGFGVRGPDTLTAWDVATGHVIRRLDPAPSSWAVSADNASLAQVAGTTLTVQNLRNGDNVASIEMGRIAGSGAPLQLALSADGSSAAAVSVPPFSPTPQGQVETIKGGTWQAAGRSDRSARRPCRRRLYSRPIC